MELLPFCLLVGNMGQRLTTRNQKSSYAVSAHHGNQFAILDIGKIDFLLA